METIYSAIAKEKKVKEITAGAFIAKYDLTATSSVKGALKRMLDEEIVYQAPDGGYMVYDRFFGEWLFKAFRYSLGDRPLIFLKMRVK